MVATALVLMADRMRNPIVTISTAIIINREIGVSALREWMASMNQRDAVAVGWWGKVRERSRSRGKSRSRVLVADR
jgi:CDP-diacylglycerol---glycerol-3-phosphate 3-phosphatidyltransferase